VRVVPTKNRMSADSQTHLTSEINSTHTHRLLPSG